MPELVTHVAETFSYAHEEEARQLQRTLLQKGIDADVLLQNANESEHDKYGPYKFEVIITKPPKGKAKLPDEVRVEIEAAHKRWKRASKNVTLNIRDLPPNIGLTGRLHPVRYGVTGLEHRMSWDEVASLIHDPNERVYWPNSTLLAELSKSYEEWKDVVAHGVAGGPEIYEIFRVNRPGSCMAGCDELLEIYAANPDIVQAVWIEYHGFHQSNASALVWQIDGKFYLDRCYSDVDTSLTRQILTTVFEQTTGEEIERDDIYDGDGSIDLSVTLNRPHSGCVVLLPYTDSFTQVSYWNKDTVTLVTGNSTVEHERCYYCNSTEGTSIAVYQCPTCCAPCEDEDVCFNCRKQCWVTREHYSEAECKRFVLCTSVGNLHDKWRGPDATDAEFDALFIKSDFSDYYVRLEYARQTWDGQVFNPHDMDCGRVQQLVTGQYAADSQCVMSDYGQFVLKSSISIDESKPTIRPEWYDRRKIAGEPLPR